jgi:hypothetical protein
LKRLRTHTDFFAAVATWRSTNGAPTHVFDRSAAAQASAQTQIQTCIVHLLRNSMDYAGWKDRKPIATALKAV